MIIRILTARNGRRNISVRDSIIIAKCATIRDNLATTTLKKKGKTIIIKYNNINIVFTRYSITGSVFRA